MISGLTKNPPILFLTSLMVLILTAIIFNRFLYWHEHRTGIYFQDPFFTLFKAIDLSVITFIALYSSIFLYIALNFKKWQSLSLVIISYTFVLWMRLLMLWILPFYADYDAVKLNDPLLNTFIYPGNYVARDLFFSGHVALLTLLILGSEKQWMKMWFTLTTIIVGITVVLQKVHFSVDVIAAPFFSLLAFYMARKIIIRR